MRVLWIVLGLLLALQADARPIHGSATVPISGSASPTTIYASASGTATAMGCDTTPGSYAKTAAGIYTNSAIVAGLVPSTLYYCKLTTGGVDHIFQTTTLATPSTTALTGATFGSAVNPIPNQNSGDTYFNATSDDGITYVVTNDTNTGWGGSTYYPMQIGKFTSTSPFTGANVNEFLSFRLDFGGYPKLFGMMSFNKIIYAIYSNICGGSCAGVPANVFTQFSSAILLSKDHGATWCNDQTPNATCLPDGTFPTPNSPPSPPTHSFFDTASGCPQSSFVSYGADNGTVLPTYRIDNSDAYAYFLCTSPVAGQSATGYQFNGDDFFLVRMPLAAFANMDATKLQYYIGGPSGNGIDGSLDGAWQSTYSGAISILHNAGKQSNAIMQYMPATGRYVLFDWYWPSPGTWSNSTWITYECSHPWTCTSTPIETHSNSPQGWYNPVPYAPSALTATLNGNAMTLLIAGDFSGGGVGPYYQLWTQTVVLH